MVKRALQGQLEEGGLAGLLQYLASTDAYGCLQLRSDQGHVGKVFFHQGKVVHVTCESRVDVEALSVLLGWYAGTFSFDVDVPAPTRTVKLSLDGLLLEAAYRADVARMSPSEELRGNTVLAPQSGVQGKSTVSVTLRALQVLRYFDGKRTLAEVAKEAGLELDDAVQAAQELLTSRLALVASGPVVPKAFIKELEKIGVNIMGPIAEIVIDDVAYDLGVNLETMPATLLPEFIGEVARQFKRQDWRREFEQQVEQLGKKHNLRL